MMSVNGGKDSKRCMIVFVPPHSRRTFHRLRNFKVNLCSGSMCMGNVVSVDGSAADTKSCTPGTCSLENLSRSCLVEVAIINKQ